jgi:hypothetical protein
MSSHQFIPESYSLEAKLVRLVAVVNFGASGAPSLQFWNVPVVGSAGSYTAAGTTAGPFSPSGTKGISKVTRNGAGDFTITLQGTYQRLLGVNVAFVNSAAPAAPSFWVKSSGTNVGTSGGGTVEVIFNAAGTATDPASGEQALIEIVLSDSTVA